MNDAELYETVMQNRVCFSKAFIQWIPSNTHVYRLFEHLADMLWSAGRAHYSARTIVEKMRFDHAIVANNSDFKMPNAISPDLGRLYALCHLERGDLFDYMERRGCVNFKRYLEAMRFLYGINVEAA